MKKLLLLIALVFLNKSLSQSAELINSTWYLTEFIGSDISTTPPISPIIGQSILHFAEQNDEYLLTTNFCNTFYSDSVTYDDSSNSFSFATYAITLGTCPNQILQNFESLYLNFYQSNVSNDMVFEIYENGEYDMLTITAPNGDRAIYNSQLLSINSPRQSAISISPNPTNGKFEVVLEPLGTYQINIIDAIGKTVYSDYATTFPHFVDLSGFQSGIYIIQLQNDEKRLYERIVKY